MKCFQTQPERKQGEEIPFCNLQAADRNNDGVIDPLEYARAVDMGMLPGLPSQYSYSGP